MQEYFKGLLNTTAKTKEKTMKEKRAETLQRLGVKEYQDSWGHISFRPQGKEGHVAPAIIREYYEKEIKNGETIRTRMYKCAPYDGVEPVHYIADKYDAMFLPAHNKKMITSRPTKGNNGNFRTKR
jgi:hypothetical protein